MSIKTAGTGLTGLLGLRRSGCPVGVEAGETWLRVARRPGPGHGQTWELSGLDLEPNGHQGGQAASETGSRDPNPRLAEAARRAGIARGPALCVLSSPAVDIFPLSLRSTDSEPLDQLVVKHAQMHLGEELEDAVLDFAVLPGSVVRPGEKTVAVLVFAARRNLVDDLLRKLEAVGLEVERLLTPACVLAPRLRGVEPGRRYLVIGTAEGATSVSVVQDGHVLLERIFSWGFQGLAHRLQEELDLDPAKCRMLLCRGHPSPTEPAPSGEAGPEETAPEDALRQVLEPEFQELVRQAAGCLGYCDSFFRPAEMAAAIVCGPLAGCAPLLRALAEGLGLPVRGPREGLDIPHLDDGSEGLAFNTAACCALWSGREAS